MRAKYGDVRPVRVTDIERVRASREGAMTRKKGVPDDDFGIVPDDEAEDYAEDDDEISDDEDVLEDDEFEDDDYDEDDDFDEDFEDDDFVEEEEDLEEINEETDDDR
jgi:hypothetical protein